MPLAIPVSVSTQRLPMVGVECVGRGVPAVLWLVAGVVRVRLGLAPIKRDGCARLVGQLVGAVMVAPVQDRLGGGGADHGGAGGVGPVGHIAQVDHLLRIDGLAGWEQVDQGGVGGEADRPVLVVKGPVGRLLAQVAAHPGADRDRVIGRPGVIDRGVDHGQRPRGDGGAGLGGHDGVQHLLVPGQDHAVADGRLGRRHANPRGGQTNTQRQDHHQDDGKLAGCHGHNRLAPRADRNLAVYAGAKASGRAGRL
jgi:hypothetical protein